MTESIETPQTEEASQPQGEGISQVREAKERADARADAYRKQLVEVRLRDIGLASDEGLGVAIAETFKGEPTLEEISAFAAEKYKYSYAPGQVQTTPSNAPSEQYQNAVTMTEAVMSGSQAVELTPELTQQVMEADARIGRARTEGEVPRREELVGGIAAKVQASRNS